MTATVIGSGPAGRPDEPPGTRQILLQLRRWLLAATALALVVSFAAVHQITATAETIHSRTAAALLEVASARESLVEADRAAVHSFGTGEVALAGPGELYQRQIGAAGQSLARVAEANEAGNSGSRILQVVEGLIAVYTGSIGQADAYFRPHDSGPLGAAELWNASQLLHMKEGVLAQLDALRDVERSALDRQLSTGWMDPALLPLWAVPFLALFALLILSQRYVRQRFRRVVNIPLLIATVVLVGLTVGMAFSVDSQQRLQNAGGELDSLLVDWHQQTAASDTAGQRALAGVMLKHCRRGVDCGRTVDGVLAMLPSPKHQQKAKSPQALQKATAAVNRDLARADRTSSLNVLIPVGMISIGVLVVLGLLPRLDEYRYRSRQ